MHSSIHLAISLFIHLSCSIHHHAQFFELIMPFFFIIAKQCHNQREYITYKASLLSGALSSHRKKHRRLPIVCSTQHSSIQSSSQTSLAQFNHACNKCLKMFCDVVDMLYLTILWNSPFWAFITLHSLRNVQHWGNVSRGGHSSLH